MSERSSALDWDARFRAERTPWERPSLNPAFVAWRASGELAACRILLPGAGRSGEPLALARDGFDVTAVDLSPTAAEVQRVRLEAAGLAGAIIKADLLAWQPSAAFDAVYDQTCLCALPPAVVGDYVAGLQRWLRPEGRLFILFMQTGAEGGPPFDCPIDRMRSLFGAGWSWPDAIGEPIVHGTATREIPVVLTRL